MSNMKKKTKIITRKRIIFHGTPDKKTADRILKTGFKKGTYFARHLEDSLEFGGKYIFYVVMLVNGDDWQIVSDKISPSAITRLVNINPKELYSNNKAADKLFGKSKPYPCPNCGEDIGKVPLSIFGKPTKPKCPKCKKNFNQLFNSMKK